jgi:hypothetical protein
MSDTAYISAPKLCDICKHESKTDVTAEYDARITSGPGAGSWANVCEIHFASRTSGGLGTGVGQRLIVGPKPDRDVLIRKALMDEDMDALFEAVGDGDPADLF